MEQIFPELSALVEREILRMEGGAFHNAIEDWFRYNGRTFDVKIYDRFRENTKSIPVYSSLTNS
jgi:hypothetical protein